MVKCHDIMIKEQSQHVLTKPRVLPKAGVGSHARTPKKRDKISQSIERRERLTFLFVLGGEEVAMLSETMMIQSTYE